MKKWEYTSVSIRAGEYDGHLNTYGEGGWELISVTFIPATWNTLLYTFKRELVELPHEKIVLND
jgi:hypothetical protein